MCTTTATTPGAAIAAINSFDNPEVVILGGSDKRADYSDLAEAISVHTNIHEVILIGDMAGKIDTHMLIMDRAVMAASEIDSSSRRPRLPGGLVRVCCRACAASMAFLLVI